MNWLRRQIEVRRQAAHRARELFQLLRSMIKDARAGNDEELFRKAAQHRAASHPPDAQ